MRRRAITTIIVGATAVALAGAVWVGVAGAKAPATARQYVVLAEPNATPASVRAAVVRAGGRVVRQNTTVGLYTVVSKNRNFIRTATRTPAIRSAGTNRPVGQSFAKRHKRLDLAMIDRALSRATLDRGPRGGGGDDDDRRHRGKDGEPLAGLQWDMDMINATRSTAHRRERGDKKVLVGVIDSGIDASHPDIAPNFSRQLSRNFTTDIPGLDDGCGTVPAPCKDPADVDGDQFDGHGTHVAGTIAAASNGLGIAGVAPRVTLVNLRAGQDSGYFFLQSTVDAMTYAADNGIDVVNMSYFTDPWLYNCRANPNDTPEQQAEQALIIDATQRAADYARSKGVTLIAALGNEATDLGNPTFDAVSPDFPPNAGIDPPRPIDNTCIDVPAETDGVISVSSLGPSGAKSDFSNYGVEQTDLSAPGGFFRDNFGTDRFGVPENMILSTYPESVARANDRVNPDGSPKDSELVRDCNDLGVCGYYQYIQGTSMAAPHVAGVAALIVSKYGSKRRGKGIRMDPRKVERILLRTARDTACPEPRLVDYTVIGRPAEWNAECVGTPDFNGFYGHGVVDALAAVRRDR